MTGVNQMLAQMATTVKDGNPVYFSIEFWKEDGSLGKIKKASKNAKSGKRTQGKINYNLKSKGLLMIFNHDIGEFRSIKITSIETFNGIQVFH